MRRTSSLGGFRTVDDGVLHTFSRSGSVGRSDLLTTPGYPRSAGEHPRLALIEFGDDADLVVEIRPARQDEVGRS